MSNLIKLAPYAYLTKKSTGATLYDLLLLVPVDASGDTDLSNVNPVKPAGTRITIDYTTNGSNAGTLYRFKHFEIDSNGTYLDVQIRGNNSTELTTVLAFADADNVPASVVGQMQTCAPYLFANIETVGTSNYIRPSCIILFDILLGAVNESIIFAPNSCTLSYTLGNVGITTDPTKFAINQPLKAVITANQEYVFDVGVEGNINLGKPPRKGKTRKTIS
ncbi:MAG: hypothetical protein ACKVT2_07635 [Saprospiraceae bacterium]